jgi:hypothetical protein
MESLHARNCRLMMTTPRIISLIFAIIIYSSSLRSTDKWLEERHAANLQSHGPIGCAYLYSLRIRTQLLSHPGTYPTDSHVACFFRLQNF